MSTCSWADCEFEGDCSVEHAEQVIELRQRLSALRAELKEALLQLDVYKRTIPVAEALEEDAERRGFQHGFYEGFRRAWVELKPFNWGPDQVAYCASLLQDYKQTKGGRLAEETYKPEPPNE